VPARACLCLHRFVHRPRRCIRHAVNVQAETLYEAAVLAIRASREHECAPGAASQLEVEAKSPSDKIMK
jgi:hypothetical protein